MLGRCPTQAAGRSRRRAVYRRHHHHQHRSTTSHTLPRASAARCLPILPLPPHACRVLSASLPAPPLHACLADQPASPPPPHPTPLDAATFVCTPLCSLCFLFVTPPPSRGRRTTASPAPPPKSTHNTTRHLSTTRHTRKQPTRRHCLTRLSWSSLARLHSATNPLTAPCLPGWCLLGARLAVGRDGGDDDRAPPTPGGLPRAPTPSHLCVQSHPIHPTLTPQPASLHATLPLPSFPPCYIRQLGASSRHCGRQQHHTSTLFLLAVLGRPSPFGCAPAMPREWSCVPLPFAHHSRASVHPLVPCAAATGRPRRRRAGQGPPMHARHIVCIPVTPPLLALLFSPRRGHSHIPLACRHLCRGVCGAACPPPRAHIPPTPTHSSFLQLLLVCATKHVSLARVHSQPSSSSSRGPPHPFPSRLFSCAFPPSSPPPAPCVLHAPSARGSLCAPLHRYTAFARLPLLRLCRLRVMHHPCVRLPTDATAMPGAVCGRADMTRQLPALRPCCAHDGVAATPLHAAPSTAFARTQTVATPPQPPPVLAPRHPPLHARPRAAVPTAAHTSTCTPHACEGPRRTPIIETQRRSRPPVAQAAFRGTRLAETAGRLRCGGRGGHSTAPSPSPLL